MKFKSQLVTQVSGSIGGLTGSHNAGGMYMRARAIPTNPNTPYQQTVRSAMSQLTSLWLSTLTEDQRQAWNSYAEQTYIPDALGDPRNIGGLGHFVRSNVPRIQTGAPRVDDAPVVFNLGEYTEPVIGVISAGAGTMSIAYSATDDWANEDDAFMLFYISRPKNASINYFKGPYRFAGSVAGDSVTPPTSPEVVTMPFPVDIGHRVFLKANVTRADGRYAATFRDNGVAVA